jgi:hypothetical protein
MTSSPHWRGKRVLVVEDKGASAPAKPFELRDLERAVGTALASAAR